MSAEVRRKLQKREADDPRGRSEDPFADFREVELLRLEQSFRYRHSLGKVSRFFLALEEEKLLATRCPDCGRVWLPPRPLCAEDLTVTSWTELSGRGRVVSWTLCPRAPRYARTGEPYLLAYLELEGASTLFLQRLREVTPEEMYYGLSVRVVFAAEPVEHPLELFWFEPIGSP